MAKSRAEQHIENLLAGFGNPAEWEFTEDITEHDTRGLNPMSCTCGKQPIRYAYWWARKDDPKKRLPTGCKCVEALPGIQAGDLERMRAAREALERREVEKRKAMKAVSKSAAVAGCARVVRQAIENKCARVEEARKAGGWLSPSDYGLSRECADYRHDLRAAEQAKTPTGQRGRLQKIWHMATQTPAPPECDNKADAKVRAFLATGPGAACVRKVREGIAAAVKRSNELPPLEERPRRSFRPGEDWEAASAAWEARNGEQSRLTTALYEARGVDWLVHQASTPETAMKRLDRWATMLTESGCER